MTDLVEKLQRRNRKLTEENQDMKIFLDKTVYPLIAKQTSLNLGIMETIKEMLGEKSDES